jgi:acetylornithine deacetylase/succinyl-diaminopimelate desuccinylase-like protein
VSESADARRAVVWARARRRRFLKELAAFVRFPSVSADPRRRVDVAACARWLGAELRRIRLDRVAVIPTAGHPIVLGESGRLSDRPTILIYGHYDVQPVEPLAAWASPPFEPFVRGGKLYGRGSSDDKGQLFAHVKAIEAYVASSRRLPVNVVCLFEGEEEIGSPHLRGFLSSWRQRLRSDVAVISDTRMLGPGRPALTYSLRGSLAFDLEVIASRSDLHSGYFGGAVRNPLEALARILCSLHDAEGHIAIRGFYGSVRPIPARELEYMRRSGPTDAEVLAAAGVPDGWGEHTYTLYERTTIRPSLTVSGLAGGHASPGVKAVIPNKGLAKLSFRLVPDQEPNSIERLLREHLHEVAPPDVHWRLRRISSARPAVVPRAHPGMMAAAAAYRASFGAPPVFVRSGGTIPVVSMLEEVLGISTVLMGFGLPNDSIHAPNERFDLDNFFKGIDTSIRFLSSFAAVGRRSPRTWSRSSPATVGFA